MPDVSYNILGLEFRGVVDLLFGFSRESATGLLAFFLSVWQVYSIVAFLLSGLLLVGIVYAKVRYAHLSEIEHAELHAAEVAYAKQYGEGSKNTRWQDALGHVESDNPNDWRLAIIEADIMLEELLDSLGFPGNTIGDKLKQASPETFKTIDDAWKAHKIRNDVAHRGTDFVLTKRSAREALERYQRVFEEFSLV